MLHSSQHYLLETDSVRGREKAEVQDDFQVSGLAKWNGDDLQLSKTTRVTRRSGEGLGGMDGFGSVGDKNISLILLGSLVVSEN